MDKETGDVSQPNERSHPYQYSCCYRAVQHSAEHKIVVHVLTYAEYEYEIRTINDIVWESDVWSKSYPCYVSSATVSWTKVSGSEGGCGSLAVDGVRYTKRVKEFVFVERGGM